MPEATRSAVVLVDLTDGEWSVHPHVADALKSIEGYEVVTHRCVIANSDGDLWRVGFTGDDAAPWSVVLRLSRAKSADGEACRDRLRDAYESLVGTRPADDGGVPLESLGELVRALATSAESRQAGSAAANAQLTPPEIARLLEEDASSWLGVVPKEIEVAPLGCVVIYRFPWGSIVRDADQFDGVLHDVITVNAAHGVPTVTAWLRSERDATYISDDPRWQMFQVAISVAVCRIGRCGTGESVASGD